MTGAHPAGGATGGEQRERHLLWRATKDSKPIVVLWLTPTRDGCELSSDVYPLKSLRVDPLSAGPYSFSRAEDAQAFAQEAAQALLYLGCEIVEGSRAAAAEPHAPVARSDGMGAPPGASGLADPGTGRAVA